MTYDEGLRLFKSANYRAAAEQFAAVTEADENNHQAWNALGICLSKLGEYENAGTCFDNAVMLAPDNPTYRKNQAGNEKKRQSRPALELDDDHKTTGDEIKKTPVDDLIWKGVKIVGGALFAFIIFCVLISIAIPHTPQSDQAAFNAGKATGEGIGDAYHATKSIVVKPTPSSDESAIYDAIFLDKGKEYFEIMSTGSDNIIRAASNEDYNGLKYYSSDTLSKIRVIKEDIDDLKVSSKIQPVFPGFISLLDKSETAYSLMNQGATYALSGDFNSANSKLQQATRQINELKGQMQEYNQLVETQIQQIKEQQ